MANPRAVSWKPAALGLSPRVPFVSEGKWDARSQIFKHTRVGMKADARRSLIQDRVLAEGEVEFALLAQEFGVSEMTIRRDIDALQSQGVLRRVTGGAIAFTGRGYEPPYKARALSAVDQKRNIAEAIVKLLRPEESIILDSGSSALAVARAIRNRSLALTIVTPSLLVALELVDEADTTVILTGGTARPGELSLIGPDTDASLAQYSCDTFIMGIAGVDAVKGATEYHREEAAVKRAALKSAARVIVGADASKLGQVHLVAVAPLRDIDVIVSDASPDDPTLTEAKKLGVEIIHVADPDQSEPVEPIQ